MDNRQGWMLPLRNMVPPYVDHHNAISILDISYRIESILHIHEALQLLVVVNAVQLSFS
jgi:hypothetical protein